MILPKIKFREMTLEENINVIKWAYFSDNKILNIHDFIVKYFPELANLNSNLSREEIYKIIEKVVTNNYTKFKHKITKETERYSLLWKKYNDKYFTALSLFFEIDWPDKITEIDASVGLIPIFPRYLDYFSFSISTDLPESRLIEVCAHETLHFLWFTKWKKLHPETERQEYEAPYLVWQYSEMVTDPILNNLPFKNIFPFNERGYDSFYEIDDNGCKVMDNLRELYSKDISIEEKINQGYEYISRVLDKQKMR